MAVQIHKRSGFGYPTQNYDPQAMPFERHKLQFIFEYLMPRRVQLEPWGDEQVVAG